MCLFILLLFAVQVWRGIYGEAYMERHKWRGINGEAYMEMCKWRGIYEEA
jgi:hypothetical protein